MQVTDRLAGLVLAGALAACSSVRTDESFADVQELVRARTSHTIHWDQNGAADREAAAAIEQILAHEMTADGAVQVALMRNRDLQATFETLGVAQADLVGSGLLKNPVFDAQVRFPEGGGTPGLDLGVSQSFLSVLFLPLRKRVAAEHLEATKLRITQAVIDLEAQVRARFYEVVASRQLVDTLQSVSEATDAAAELARRLFDVGNVRDVDRDNEWVLHEESRQAHAAAQLALIERREALNGLLGIWGTETKWREPAHLAVPPPSALDTHGLEGRVIARSLALEALQRDSAAIAEQLGITRQSAGFSDIDIGITAEREPVEGRWSVGPSIGLPLPLFDQGQPEIARAQSMLRMKQDRIHQTAVELRARTRALAARLVALEQRLAHYRAVLLPLRSRITQSMQLQYNAMQEGPFQLLLAKRQEIATGIRYVETLRDWWLARTTLDQLLAGGSPSGSLSESNVASAMAGSFDAGTETQGGHP